MNISTHNCLSSFGTYSMYVCSAHWNMPQLGKCWHTMVDIQAASRVAQQVESGVVLKPFRRGHILIIDPRTPQIPVYICIWLKSTEMFVSSDFKGTFKVFTFFPPHLEKLNHYFSYRELWMLFSKMDLLFLVYFKYIKHIIIPFNLFPTGLRVHQWAFINQQKF